jgi:hypothetical protein
MNDASQPSNTNIIPVWGLTPDECEMISTAVQKLEAQGRVTSVKEKRRRTYVCIYDHKGARYTITREQRILHLLDPIGNLVMIGKNIDVILDMLDACLPESILSDAV